MLKYVSTGMSVSGGSPSQQEEEELDRDMEGSFDEEDDGVPVQYTTPQASAFAIAPTALVAPAFTTW